jgi:hypothetical protein
MNRKYFDVDSFVDSLESTIDGLEDFEGLEIFGVETEQDEEILPIKKRGRPKKNIDLLSEEG